MSIWETKEGYRLAGYAEGLDKFRYMAYLVSNGVHLMTETNRFIAGYREFDEQFMTPEYSVAVAKRLKEGNWDPEVIFDVSVLEVFADGGLNMITMVVFPDTPYDMIKWKGHLNVSLFEIS